MNRKIISIILLILLLGVGFTGMLVAGDPEGAQISNNVTVTVTPASAGSITTAGGSFTTMLLNATSQTLKWKAYVGNVTGELALRDAAEQSIYSWDLTTVTGEVYASRNSTITWSNIQCVTNGTLAQEESELNIGNTDIDSINETFNNTIHAEFFVGTTQIAQSTCRAIATYINDAAQAPSPSADFQLILLDDTVSMVYSTLLEDAIAGYNNDQYDFQLIVAEDPTTDTANTYYFWAELG